MVLEKSPNYENLFAYLKGLPSLEDKLKREELDEKEEISSKSSSGFPWFSWFPESCKIMEHNYNE
jgi:hypothetical protein